jgi:hypothetical protein
MIFNIQIYFYYFIYYYYMKNDASLNQLCINKKFAKNIILLLCKKKLKN